MTCNRKGLKKTSSDADCSAPDEGRLFHKLPACVVDSVFFGLDEDFAVVNIFLRARWLFGFVVIHLGGVTLFAATDAQSPCARGFLVEVEVEPTLVHLSRLEGCPCGVVCGEEAGIAVFGCLQNPSLSLFYTIEHTIEEDRYGCLINGSPAIFEASLVIYADIAEAVFFAIGSLKAVVVVGSRRGNLPIVSEHEVRNISLL